MAVWGIILEILLALSHGWNRKSKKKQKGRNDVFLLMYCAREMIFLSYFCMPKAIHRKCGKGLKGIGLFLKGLN